MKKFKSWVMQYIKIENVKNYPKLTERDLIFLNDKLKNDILKDSGNTSVLDQTKLSRKDFSN